MREVYVRMVKPKVGSGNEIRSSFQNAESASLISCARLTFIRSGESADLPEFHVPPLWCRWTSTNTIFWYYQPFFILSFLEKNNNNACEEGKFPDQQTNQNYAFHFNWPNATRAATSPRSHHFDTEIKSDIYSLYKYALGCSLDSKPTLLCFSFLSSSIILFLKG